MVYAFEFYSTPSFSFVGGRKENLSRAWMNPGAGPGELLKQELHD